MPDLTDIASRVRAARLARGWGREKAAREADVSSITWKRVEDGLPVRDTSLVAVFDALGLRVTAPGESGSADLAGLLASDPTLTPAAREHITRQYRLLQRLSELEVTPDFAREVDRQAIRDSDELSAEAKRQALEAEEEARGSRTEDRVQEPKGRRRSGSSG